jgi:hypothetical protein
VKTAKRAALLKAIKTHVNERKKMKKIPMKKRLMKNPKIRAAVKK